MKKKKPKWKRQQHYLKRLKDRWRKSRGTHSKMRKKIKGRPKMPNIGYKKPEEVRGLHPSGYFPVLVHNTRDLERVNPEKEAALIGKIGKKKRQKVIEKAKEMGVKVLNE